MKWLALTVLMVVLTGAGLFVLNIPDAEAPVSPENTTAVRENVATLSRTLVTVYDGITVSNNISELNIAGRNLTGSLKAEVGQLSDLRELDISHNQFTGVPAEVGSLEKLEKLNLSHNPITGLPLEIGNLKNLKLLDLRNTSYSEYDLDLIKRNLPEDTVIMVGGQAGDEN